MVKQALGLIETVGLAAAIAAADAAVKAANVTLVGYELTRGGGLTVVKLFGDVGAVKAAVDAGKVAADKVNKVWATHVIPRPHSDLTGLLINRQTVGCEVKPDEAVDRKVQPEQVATQPVSEPEPSQPETLKSEPASSKPEAAAPQTEPEAEESKPEKEAVKPESMEEEASKPEPENLEKGPGEICNLCLDPACGRRKGEPRVNCIHYKDNK